MALKPQGNNILAGTSLAIAQIQSPDYVPGVSGWCIFQNGNAEFNAGTFRGYIVGGSLFLYNGTPGVGTLVLSATPLTSDPFGNTTQPGGLAVYSGSAYAQLHINSVFGPALEQVTGATSEAHHGAFYQAIVNKGLVNELIESNWIGPGSSSGGVQALLQLVSAAADGSTLAGGVIYNVVYGGATTNFAHWNYEGFSIDAGTAFAVKPGTGTSDANPAVAEIWHAMSPLLNSWAAVAGNVANQYRRVAAPVNSIEIIGVLTATAATASTFFTLPSAYRPASQQQFACGATSGVTANNAPYIQCDTSGNLTVNRVGLGAANTAVYHGLIALDA